MKRQNNYILSRDPAMVQVSCVEYALLCYAQMNTFINLRKLVNITLIEKVFSSDSHWQPWTWSLRLEHEVSIFCNTLVFLYYISLNICWNMQEKTTCFALCQVDPERRWQEVFHTSRKFTFLHPNPVNSIFFYFRF
ncbi:unnamed protein product [Ilex paraguariensis]|uniref:Uncharacterized protein n=1 Tax=Ilex paraguariensis TaxID=185542 RepID=A0ABC8U8B4_9AQUA